MNEKLIKSIKSFTVSTIDVARILGVNKDKAHDIVQFIRNECKKNYKSKSNLDNSDIFVSDLFNFLGFSLDKIKTCKKAEQNEVIDYLLNKGIYNTTDLMSLLHFKRFETAKKRTNLIRENNPYFYRNKKSILKETEISVFDLIKYYGFSNDDIASHILYCL